MSKTNDYCQHGNCALPASATQPMPDATRFGTPVGPKRLCRRHAAARIVTGFLVVRDSEEESVALLRQDKILKEKHRRVAGSDAYRFDAEGNFLPQAIAA